MSDNPAPKHPFEIEISIGADDWEYARRAARQIADYIEERDPDHCGMCSGGGGGCYSIDVAKRDVPVEQFHTELEQWRQGLIADQPMPDSGAEGEGNK